MAFDKSHTGTSKLDAGFRRALPQCSLALAVSTSLAFFHPDSVQGRSFPAQLDASSLDGSNGFVLDGATAGEQSGIAVSVAGDINGDGIDDLIIGADLAETNGLLTGRSYVVFGSTAGFSTPLNLADLDGSNGFIIDGEAELDYAGRSVSFAGDINGDGIDDLLIGAFGAQTSGTRTGRSYVVFGSTGNFSSPFDLSLLNGLNGLWLNGEFADDRSGVAVSGAGDINGDGIDDLIIGAIGADPNGAGSGRSYVVFGSDGGLPNPFNLATLNGLNGFVLNGEAAGDALGRSVSAAGDINGDDIDDLIVGSPFADSDGTDSGRSYVIFGSDQGLPNPFNLSTLNGQNGFAIDGEASRERLGTSVAAAGDINNDGIEDLVIGAYLADPDDARSYAGRSYVLFGSDTGWPDSVDLSKLNGTNGFVINGESPGDFLGRSVSAAGDVNGDGIEDLVIGADGADPNGGLSGRSYVVFGSRTGFPNPLELSALDGQNGFVINGEAAGDALGFSVSAAGDLNADGLDDLIIGANRADSNGVDAGRSYVVFGRGDALFSDRFEGKEQ
jgi:hypothetical protein